MKVRCPSTLPVILNRLPSCFQLLGVAFIAIIVSTVSPSPAAEVKSMQPILYSDTQKFKQIKREMHAGTEADYVLKPLTPTEDTATASAGSPKLRPPITGEVGKVEEGGEKDKPAPILKLHVALNEGLMNSPRTAAVRALLNISKAGYWQATVSPNPNFLFDDGYIAELTRRAGSQITFSAPWKVVLRLLAAKAQFKETKLEIMHTLWGFRNDVRRAYTEVVVAEATYHTLADLVALSGRLLEVSQKRFQAGDVPELDVLKARLANSQAEIDLQQGLRRITRAKQQLNVILGRPVQGEVAMPKLPTFQLSAEKSEFLPDFDEPLPPLSQFVSEALQNRWELKVIKQQIKLTQAQLHVSCGNIIPDQVWNIGQSRTGNPASGPLLIGFFTTLNIEVPMYNFQQGDIARLKETSRQFYLQYGAQRNQVVGEVSSAYNNLLVAREKIRTYREHVLADSEEVARLARRSYEVGQSDITSTLQAQQANVQIRSQYLDAVNAYQQAYTDLEQSIGEPIED